MGSAKQDYVLFLRWLHDPQQGVNEAAKRFANMVLANFDEIAATARQRNARSAALVGLARRHLAASPAELPEIDMPAAAEEWPWRRLKELTVGPFRGFRREEQFDLRRRVILFYGPNGSGKTSLCEALERGLLGAVEEAELKRIDERRYLANIHTRNFIEPRLVATTANGDDIPVIADADRYRFSFIEKNRIDAFSRMAARPPAQRTELIAALFGMDKFNDFVGHFNEQMDAELVLRSDKQTALRLRREGIARDQATARDEAQTLARHDEDDARYAQGYLVGTTYARLKEIIGTPEAPGRLWELNHLLNAVPARIIGLTRETLMLAYEAIDAIAAELRQTTQDLARRSSQVSFKDLYTAVTALQAGEGDHCPACDTPLDRVVRDPYEKARIGLDELRDLADLQERQRTKREALVESSRELREHLNQIYRYLEGQDRTQSEVGQYLGRLPRQPDGDTWWTEIYGSNAAGEGVVPSLEQIAAIVDEMEQRDVAARVQIDERAARVRERDALLECQRHVEARELQRKIIVDAALEARTRVEQFELANAALIAEAEQERQDSRGDRLCRKDHRWRGCACDGVWQDEAQSRVVRASFCRGGVVGWDA